MKHPHILLLVAMLVLAGAYFLFGGQHHGVVLGAAGAIFAIGSVYQIPAIDDDHLDVAVSTATGAETRVFLSYDGVKNAADIEQTAPGTGDDNDDGDLVFDGAALTLDRTYRSPTTVTEGRDLQLVCNSPVQSEEAVEVVLNVTFENVVATITSNSIAAASVVTTSAPHGLASGDTVLIAGVTSSVPTINGSRVITVLSPTTFSVPINVTTGGTGGTATSTARNGTATATLEPPDRVNDQSFNFPQGLAVDFTPSVEGLKVREIVSVASITGGAAGDKFSIVSLPEASSFQEVACATQKNFTPPTPQAVSIPCRYNAARWIKRGRSTEPKLDLKANYSSFGDGLPRSNGQRVTVKLETYKDDSILTERAVFGGVRAEVNVTHGDGDTVSEATFTGKYETMAIFV